MLEKLKSKTGLSNVIYILLGLFLLLRPGTTTAIITRLIGIAALIYGITRIVDKGKYDMDFVGFAIAVVITIAGVFLIFNPSFIAKILPTILGIYVLIEGAGEMRSALIMRSHGYSRWVTSFALSLLVIIVGIVVLVNPFATMNLVFMVFGGAMVVSGVAGLLDRD